MINKNLPEPECKECGVCGRSGPDANLTGELIHVPDENCTREEVTTINGYVVIEPFSFWFYRCRWCRGAYSRQQNKYQKAATCLHEWEEIIDDGDEIKVRCKECGKSEWVEVPQ